PVQLPPDVRDDLRNVGEVLGGRCDLLGLFGVDFVFHDGRPWVVEVNPRYPASVEVLELATGVPAIPLHRMAFDPEAGPGPHTPPRWPVAGKAVLYAPRRLVVLAFDSRDGGDLLDAGVQAAGHHASTHIVDIPATGEVIEQGSPVLTILAEADSR